MITSGSWRRMARRPLPRSEGYLVGGTGICATPASSYSTGSSIVTIFFSGARCLFSDAVKRGGLAAAGWAGGQNRPCGFSSKSRHQFRAVPVQNPSFQRHGNARVLFQQPHHQAFAIYGGHGADPDVHARPPVLIWNGPSWGLRSAMFMSAMILMREPARGDGATGWSSAHRAVRPCGSAPVRAAPAARCARRWRRR